MDAKVLNSMDYGNVPQTRERIYMVGFRTPRTLMKFHWPEEVPLTKTIASVLEKKSATAFIIPIKINSFIRSLKLQ